MTLRACKTPLLPPQQPVWQARRPAACLCSAGGPHPDGACPPTLGAHAAAVLAPATPVPSCCAYSPGLHRDLGTELPDAAAGQGSSSPGTVPVPSCCTHPAVHLPLPSNIKKRRLNYPSFLSPAKGLGRAVFACFSPKKPLFLVCFSKKTHQKQPFFRQKTVKNTSFPRFFPDFMGPPP